VFYAQIEKVGIGGAAPKYNSRVGGWKERDYKTISKLIFGITLTPFIPLSLKVS